MEIILYTDGSSRGNPGPGGWGCVLLTKHKQTAESKQRVERGIVKELGGRDKATTNNRMELLAAIRGLEEVVKMQAEKPSPKIKDVTVKTDSEYVKKGITTWIAGWLARGWKTAANKPVMNQELWQELLVQKKKVESFGAKVEFVYVKAHAGVVLNERADTIATTFADNEPTPLYDGSRSEYMV
jgi:ribonuclease HI